MFGHWSGVLVRSRTLETPSDFRDELQKYFPDQRFIMLDYTRNWQLYLASLEVDIGGMGGSEAAAHSFTFMQMAELDSAHGDPLSNFGSPISADIVLSVKKYMHHDHLSQQPLVILPAGSVSKLSSGSPVTYCKRDTYNAELRGKLEETANMLGEAPWNLQHAKSYLIGLANGDPSNYKPLPDTPAINFLKPPTELWLPPGGAWAPPAEAELLETARPITSKAISVEKLLARTTKRKGRKHMEDSLVPSAAVREHNSKLGLPEAPNEDFDMPIVDIGPQDAVVEAAPVEDAEKFNDLD
eukprot:749164-Karenia_brevis.AAC.1